MSITMQDFDGELSLTFECGVHPADGAISAAGHEPNGYFWEGLIRFEWPDLAERLDFDSEAGMFAAAGTQDDLSALKEAIEPVIANPDKVAAIITRADAAGFQFED